MQWCINCGEEVSNAAHVCLVPKAWRDHIGEQGEGTDIKVRPVPSFGIVVDGTPKIIKYEEAVRFIIPPESFLDKALPYLFLAAYALSWFMLGLSFNR